MRAITPRRGLLMALGQADFTKARRYAEEVLKDDPDDANANFAMGMSYYVQRQWARAEEYLRKCLIGKPNEPAALNNLAIVCMETGRYDEALVLAERALKILPDSDEVKDTLKQIREARQKASREKE